MYDTCVVVCSSVWIRLFACLMYWHRAVGSLMTGLKVCTLFVASHVDTIWGETIYGRHALLSIPSRRLLCWRLLIWQTASLIATWRIQKQASIKIRPEESRILSAARDLTVGGRGFYSSDGKSACAARANKTELMDNKWNYGVCALKAAVQTLVWVQWIAAEVEPEPQVQNELKCICIEL